MCDAGVGVAFLLLSRKKSGDETRFEPHVSLLLVLLVMMVVALPNSRNFRSPNLVQHRRLSVESDRSDILLETMV